MVSRGLSLISSMFSHPITCILTRWVLTTLTLVMGRSLRVVTRTIVCKSHERQHRQSPAVSTEETGEVALRSREIRRVIEPMLPLCKPHDSGWYAVGVLAPSSAHLWVIKYACSMAYRNRARHTCYLLCVCAGTGVQSLKLINDAGHVAVRCWRDVSESWWSAEWAQ